MKRSWGRSTLLVLFGLVLGITASRMAWKGIRSLNTAKTEVQAAAPMVWPPALAPASDSFCHTVKLTMAQVDKAMEEGMAVDQNRRCISREAHRAYEAQLAERAAYQARRAQEDQKQALQAKLQAELDEAVAQQVERGGVTLQTLAQARAGHATQVASALLPGAAGKPDPLPKPPPDMFVPISYASGNTQLAGFVTPSPKDGKRHPVIIWITGGDSNSLGDFWTEGAANNDQSAAAFRKADIVMMFPTLRGGNTNPGQREYFWGEVDDVIAAVLYAAKLPYVDPGKIYLGGHSTGATLALLTAATGLPIQGVFAFGPVADPSTYDKRGIPVDWKKLDAEERRLRAPLNWLHAVKAPTWIIEGANSPGNTGDLQALCAARKSEQVHCITVAGQNHFSVLQPITRRIAAQIAMGQEPKLESAPIQ